MPASPGLAATVALTGGIGSGKSTVAGFFAALGAAVIDADAISRALTAAGGEAIDPIRGVFGAALIGADGALDRARMRALVFADPGARVRLEAILHPMIRARSDALADAAQGRLRIFDIPLLAESGRPRAERAYDRILVVDCPIERQVARAGARGGLEPAQVRAVIAAQASRAARLDIADDVLVNDGTLEALRARVHRLWRAYTGSADAAPGAV